MTNLVDIRGGESEDLVSDGGVLVDERGVGGLGEDGRVVVSVQHRDVDRGMVVQRRAAPVHRLDGQEVLARHLVVYIVGKGDEAGGGVDAKLPVLVPANYAVGDLGVNAGISGGGEHPDHLRSHLHALQHLGEVVLARKLGRVVVYI